MIMNKPLTRRKPEQKRAVETREKLLATAIAILNRDGFSKLTTRRLAKEAGISVGVIYDYFPSKQALVFWIYEERLNRRVEIFDKCLLGENLDRPLTDTFPEYILEMSREKMWSRLDLEFRLAEESDPKFSELIAQFKNELSERYVKVLKAYGSNWSEEDLMSLAQFSHATDVAGMKLQSSTDVRDRQQFFGRMVGRVTLFLMYEAGVLSAEELGEISDKITHSATGSE